MADQPELESLYREAQSALKGRDYVRAGELLRQILRVDENYKDTSRLLARVVKLRRRKWYSHPLLWGTMGLIIIVGLGIWLAPRLWGGIASPGVPPTSAPTQTRMPTETSLPTTAPSPTVTAVPLAWKRISIGQEFERDTVTIFVISPKDPEVLYAGLKNAGIFKSIDGGLSWRPAHHGLINAHVTSLLIDFQNPKILFAGTLDGIYKTEDGGEDWLRIGEGTHVLMDPQDSSHLFARDSDSIYESFDGGENWTAVFSSTEGCPDTIFSWAVHPVDGKTLFIGGGKTCEEGVYQSIDGGKTWIFAFKEGIPSEVGGDLGAAGPEWFSVGLDGQGNIGLYPAQIVAYDSTGSTYFYWDAHLRKQKPDDAQGIMLGKPDVGFFYNITIPPYDPDTIYVTGRGIAVSRDGGLTWEKLNNGLGSTTLQLELALGNPSHLYLLSGDCEQIYEDGNFEIVQPLYISTNSGIAWDFSIRAGCRLIKDADGVTLYRTSIENDWREVSMYYAIWRSQDEGKSWGKTFSTVSYVTISADPIQSGLLNLYLDIDPYEWGGYHQYVSEDHGHTWKPNNPEADVKICHGSTLRFIDAYRPMAIDPQDGDHVLVIDNGRLLESHDNCDTTSAFSTPPSTRINSIAFDRDNPNILYAGTDGGAYISFDFGRHWHEINDGLLGATVVYSIVVDKDSNVYAATPYGIFKLEGK